MRVLLDKDDLTTRLRTLLALLQSPTAQLPSSAAYNAAVSDFWYHALWSAKHLRRGELWWAKAGCDMRLKHLLLTLLEWHARCAPGAQTDTWFRGRFLETWADPRALDELRQAFAHYDQADIGRALLATMHLFRWLAMETAQRLGYPYPAQGDVYVTRLVVQLCSD
jgi:aminoglycoside 6-adenylyltransferase